MLTPVLDVNALNGADQAFVQQGQYDGYLVTFTGTNAAGQTGALSDLGSISIKRNNNETHNRPISVFADIGNIRAGTNIFSSTVASTFQASVFIPLFEEGLPNGMNIVGEREVSFRYLPASNVATVFDGLQVKIEARTTFVPEFYVYYMLGNDLNYSGAVSNYQELIPGENITTIYIDDSASSILTELQAKQDKILVIGQTTALSLRALTIYNNRIEDNTFTVIQLMLFTPGIGGSAISTKTNLGITTSGGGTIGVTVCYFVPNQRFVNQYLKAA